MSSATQHAMPPEFGRKMETECLNTRFPMPIPLPGTVSLTTPLGIKREVKFILLLSLWYLFSSIIKVYIVDQEMPVHFRNTKKDKQGLF